MVRWLCCLVVLGLTAVARAEVKLPAIFGDHMVLQGDSSIPVWGTADPGEKIAVSLGSEHAGTVADGRGKWRVELKKLKAAGKALTLVVRGTNTVEFTDVLIGDVWVASGQSNMEFGIRSADTGDAAIKAADEPMIRLFVVPRRSAAYPQGDIEPGSDVGDLRGRWQVCTPETLAHDPSVGSSANDPLGGFSAVAYFFARDIQRFTHQPVGIIDSSFGGTYAEAWISLDGLDKDPALMKRAAEHRRLQANYDAAMAAYPAALADYDAKFKQWNEVSKPANDAAMKQWQTDAAAAKAAGLPIPPQPKLVNAPSKPDPTGGPGQATALFNGMIAPLTSYAIKGVIWYQGEANWRTGAEYRTTFATLINDWRAKWHEGNFPFLFVQLPEYQDAWAALRESQLKTLALPNTGMAIAIDVGIVGNVHPPFKEVVGDRLALVAEHVAYGANLVYSGPIYAAMKVDGSAIRLSFNDVGGGLKLGTSPASGHGFVPAPADRLVTFTIAGEDQVWHPAEGRIDGDTVVVSSPDVLHPVAVRYGWDAPGICNLYNKEGLPASPFRTDSW